MKAKSMVDWRVQVDRHPLGMLGVAAGGGALVALVTGGRRAKDAKPARHRELGSVVGAVATAAALELLTQVVPRLVAHFGKKVSASR